MTQLKVLQCDISTLAVDAIVNAANQWMLGGGGVDGAIHDRAGPDLLKACRAVPEIAPRVRCPTGESRITPGFELPARYVIHTVGPVWRGGIRGESELLASCYRSALELAVENNLSTIAFPAISCGSFGYPLEQATLVAKGAVLGFLDGNCSLTEITFVAFDRLIYKTLCRLLLNE